MLVLSRKRNDRIVIAGGEIVLTVVEIRGDKVRLGIEAPKDISVHRGEVQEAIDRGEVSFAKGGAA
jgi:carbon storage regulator